MLFTVNLIREEELNKKHIQFLRKNYTILLPILSNSSIFSIVKNQKVLFQFILIEILLPKAKEKIR